MRLFLHFFNKDILNLNFWVLFKLIKNRIFCIVCNELYLLFYFISYFNLWSFCHFFDYLNFLLNLFLLFYVLFFRYLPLFCKYLNMMWFNYFLQFLVFLFRLIGLFILNIEIRFQLQTIFISLSSILIRNLLTLIPMRLFYSLPFFRCIFFFLLWGIFINHSWLCIIF